MPSRVTVYADMLRSSMAFFQLQVSARMCSGFGFVIAGGLFALGVTGLRLLAVCLQIDSRWFVDFSRINCISCGLVPD